MFISYLLLFEKKCQAFFKWNIILSDCKYLLKLQAEQELSTKYPRQKKYQKLRKVRCQNKEAPKALKVSSAYESDWYNLACFIQPVITSKFSMNGMAASINGQ